MYSIGDISRLTGITAYTLRYYEKIGVLPKPRREAGKRSYDDQDLQYVRFINGLKDTGMSLENIAAFTEEGCLLNSDESDMDVSSILEKRVSMLAEHIALLERQIQQLELVKKTAQEKNQFYSTMLKGRP